jgi:hypothetical protein
MAQSHSACLGGWCDHQLAGFVLVLSCQNSSFERVGAQRLEKLVEPQHTPRGELARPFDGKLGNLGIRWLEVHRKVTIAEFSNLRGDRVDLWASSNPETAAYRVPG